MKSKYDQLPESDFICSQGVYTVESLEKLKKDVIGKPVMNGAGGIIGKMIEAELKDGKLFVVCKMNDGSFFKTLLISNAV